MSANFPFAAIVGQDALREALLWVAIDPAIGGVLVTGTRGTAKSTAARGLADVLPPIDVIAGDAYNRAPVEGAAEVASVATPFVELPVGATEDRVIGTLDVRSLLASHERRFEPGLLARANRGILYVDEVNLLPDHVVDVVLDAAASGRNVVERDGASFAHDARIVLVGTMNPEEGELRPQLLDRFGLCVPIESDDDLDRRIEIVERRIAFERDADAYAEAFASETLALRERVSRARSLLPSVVAERPQIRRASQHALAARAEGMRADLTIVRTARAIAALAGRRVVSDDDIDRAAPAALAHRRREGSTPPAGGGPEGGPPPPASAPSPSPSGPAGAGTEGTAIAAQVFDIGAPAGIDLARDGVSKSHGTKRSLIRRVARGKGAVETARGTLRATSTPGARIAALATVTAAARTAGVTGSSGALRLEVEHLRYARRFGRLPRLVVFLVDASGSMAAASRMRAAKGVVGSLLATAYRKRDSVALIAFRGDEATTLVPPTRSAVLAFRRLRTLATGGRTPLARGLECARELIAIHRRRNPDSVAHLVVVSDARANAPQTGAFDAAVLEAVRLEREGVHALCVDTEAGRIRFGFAAKLAAALGASYQHLDDCSERALGATVREWMATA